MELIKSIFGKTVDISEEDIRERIINVKGEDSQFDAKTLLKENSPSEQNLNNLRIVESTLIKPLVAFLNSMNPHGLLGYGIHTGSKSNLCTSMIPIPDGVIKDKQQLQNKILSNIETYPKSTNLPIVHLVEVKVTGGNVYFIEIERKDDSCVYYSKITNQVYVRINDTSIPLPFSDTLNFISSKIIPKVYVYFDQGESIETGVKFNIALMNEGLEPGRYILNMLKILPNNPEIKIEIISRTVSPLDKWNKGLYKSYQIISAYPPTQSLIYPKTPSAIGELIVHSKGDFGITIEAITYENKGRYDQKIEIVKRNGEKASVTATRQFSSYLGS